MTVLSRESRSFIHTALLAGVLAFGPAHVVAGEQADRAIAAVRKLVDSGEVDALEGFTSSLPHKVECLVGLGENPLRLLRYMRITLPRGLPGGVKFEGFVVH